MVEATLVRPEETAQQESQESSESLKNNLSNRLVLHVALGQYDPDSKPPASNPTKISENSFTALENQNTAKRKKDEEDFAEKFKNERVAKGEKLEKITPERIRDVHFTAWSSKLTFSIQNDIATKKGVALAVYMKLGIQTTGTGNITTVQNQFYDPDTRTPGEFYNKYCGTNMNEAIANTLTTDDMLKIKTFLVKFMVGSEEAFNALLVLRATQERINNPQVAEIIPQDQPVSGLEGKVLKFYRDGLNMKKEKPVEQKPAEPTQEPPKPKSGPEATKSPNKQPITDTQRKEINTFLLTHPDSRELLLTPEYDVIFRNALINPQLQGESVSPSTPLFIELGNGLIYNVEQVPFTEHKTIRAYILTKEGRKELHHIYWDDRWNIKRIFTGAGKVNGADGSIKQIDNETIFDRDQYILDHPDLFSKAKTPEKKSESQNKDKLTQQIEVIIKNLNIEPGKIKRLGTEIRFTNEETQQLQTFLQEAKILLEANSTLRDFKKLVEEQAAKDTAFAIAKGWGGTGIVSNPNISQPRIIPATVKDHMRIEVPPQLFTLYGASNSLEQALSILQEYQQKLGIEKMGHTGATFASFLKRILDGYTRLKQP